MPPCLRVPSRRVSASRTDATVPARRPQFESRITSHESRITAVPALPCAGGLPPQRPPVANATVPARPQPPCQRQPYRRHRACAAPAVRITNHESRVTNHGRSGPPLCGGTPPATPPVANATVPARRPQFESRVTNHESRPFRPSLARGDSPRNAPLIQRHPPCVGSDTALYSQRPSPPHANLRVPRPP